MADIKLYQGDCLAVMNRLIVEGVKVDAIITDPPYGTTACKWDCVIPFSPMWNCLHKLIKENGAIVLFGSEPFSSALRMSNLKEYKYDWVWEKQKGSNFANANKMPLKYHEMISVFYKKQCQYNQQYIKRESNRVKQAQEKNYIGFRHFSETNPCYSIGEKINFNKYDCNKKRQGSVIRCNSVVSNSKEKVKHPTQKPISLIECLVKTYTNEGDTVLDFTMGSGTTGVACKNLNRNFIGIELDKNYFEIAKKRIENTGGLF